MGGLSQGANPVDALFPRGNLTCPDCGKRYDRAPRVVLGKDPGPRCTCGGRLKIGNAAPKPAAKKGR
jgi:hypothetical protein